MDLPKLIIERLDPAERFCVDGHEYDDPDSALAGDGEHAPFYVFDIDQQAYVTGPLPTKEAAERLRSIIIGCAAFTHLVP